MYICKQLNSKIMPNVSTASQIYNEERDKKILKEYAILKGRKSAKVKHLAEKFRMSESFIWKLLRETK